ncbi:MAG: UDP-3-O-acyl-N-acetylglucosamine deacetylase [Capsulimonas sp.]|uniref:UDP-3-O-acyl-N-acetylglucosamine deacetylase n=1 Tax=Capsulimonas sp. TaxID=2494211 RepID=UPI00326797C2
MTLGLPRLRQTLQNPSERFQGLALHSGRDAWLRLLPAEAGRGLLFVDAESGQEIPARTENLGDTSRQTQIHAGGRTLSTVEHLLSALAALRVDDVRIEVSGPELPIADGSAAPFITLIQAAGIAAHPSATAVEPLVLREPLLLTGAAGSSAVALPAPHFQATVALSYPNHPYLGHQIATFDAMTDDYASQIAPARTYGFLSEIEQLHARGLGLGASYDNALVLGETEYVTPPRFENELARHKLLDLIGDLALTGRPLHMHIVAVKPGHQLNTGLALLLSKL